MSLPDSLKDVLTKARNEYVSVLKNDLINEGFTIIKFKNEIGDTMDFSCSTIYVKYKNKNFSILLSHSGATLSVDIGGISGSASAASLAKKLNKYLSDK